MFSRLLWEAPTEALAPVRAAAPAASVEGCALAPVAACSAAGQALLYVGTRLVRSAQLDTLLDAWFAHAYAHRASGDGATLLARSTRRVRPAYVLQLNCPSGAVDVTTEPDKSVCLFRTWPAVAAVVMDALAPLWGPPPAALRAGLALGGALSGGGRSGRSGGSRPQPGCMPRQRSGDGFQQFEPLGGTTSATAQPWWAGLDAPMQPALVTTWSAVGCSADPRAEAVTAPERFTATAGQVSSRSRTLAVLLPREAARAPANPSSAATRCVDEPNGLGQGRLLGSAAWLAHSPAQQPGGRLWQSGRPAVEPCLGPSTQQPLPRQGAEASRDPDVQAVPAAMNAPAAHGALPEVQTPPRRLAPFAQRAAASAPPHHKRAWRGAHSNPVASLFTVQDAPPPAPNPASHRPAGGYASNSSRSWHQASTAAAQRHTVRGVLSELKQAATCSARSEPAQKQQTRSACMSSNSGGGVAAPRGLDPGIGGAPAWHTQGVAPLGGSGEQQLCTGAYADAVAAAVPSVELLQREASVRGLGRLVPDTVQRTHLEQAVLLQQVGGRVCTGLEKTFSRSRLGWVWGCTSNQQHHNLRCTRQPQCDCPTNCICITGRLQSDRRALRPPAGGTGPARR